MRHWERGMRRLDAADAPARRGGCAGSTRRMRRLGLADAPRRTAGRPGAGAGAMGPGPSAHGRRSRGDRVVLGLGLLPADLVPDPNMTALVDVEPAHDDRDQ